MVPIPRSELFLRAKLRHGNSSVVAHTVEFTESLMFVQTDLSAPIGERIEVELSFPGLVSPFCVETQVIAERAPLGLSEPGGLTLGFLFRDEMERHPIQNLLYAGGDPRGQAVMAPAYRVLIVEDDSFVREAFCFGIRRILRESNSVRVDLASDSQEALQRLFQRTYDLAVVDHFLPTASGVRLISRLRSNPGLSKLPIFAFSGAEDVRRASLDAGADLFLHKPAVIRSLFPTLAHLSTMRQSLAA